MNTIDSSGLYNQGVPDGSCNAQANTTLLDSAFRAGNSAYSQLSNGDFQSHWVQVNDTFNLAGPTIVEISDTDPFLGGNAGARGVLGEFFFVYVGPYEITVEPEPEVYTVTLAVDMNQETSVSPDGVYAAGTFQEADTSAATNCNNFSDDCTPLEDADGNGVWAITIEVPAGDYEYKFINGRNWSINEGAGIDSTCGVGDGFGGFNRQISVSSDTTVIYVYDSCTLSSDSIVGSVGVEEILDFNISLAPNPMDEIARIEIDNPQYHQLSMSLLNLNGQVLRRWDRVAQVVQVERKGLSSGLYLLRIQDEQGRSLTQKIMIQ
ncbi:MAG: T9SS type A sorting domain-containing protein, partial [Bacteroidota bacterium]